MKKILVVKCKVKLWKTFSLNFFFVSSLERYWPKDEKRDDISSTGFLRASGFIQDKWFTCYWQLLEVLDDWKMAQRGRIRGIHPLSWAYWLQTLEGQDQVFLLCICSILVSSLKCCSQELREYIICEQVNRAWWEAGKVYLVCLHYLNL